MVCGIRKRLNADSHRKPESALLNTSALQYLTRQTWTRLQSRNFQQVRGNLDITHHPDKIKGSFHIRSTMFWIPTPQGLFETKYLIQRIQGLGGGGGGGKNSCISPSMPWPPVVDERGENARNLSYHCLAFSGQQELFSNENVSLPALLDCSHFGTSILPEQTSLLVSSSDLLLGVASFCQIIYEVEQADTAQPDSPLTQSLSKAPFNSFSEPSSLGSHRSNTFLREICKCKTKQFLFANLQ